MKNDKKIEKLINKIMGKYVADGGLGDGFYTKKVLDLVYRYGYRDGNKDGYEDAIKRIRK